MLFDWFTWGVWSIGVVILLLWMIKTIREFRILFAEKLKTGYKSDGLD
jgi:hypothetical protein